MAFKMGKHHKKGALRDEPKYREEKKPTLNIFGRKRDVTKYYDPETNQYLGKKVQVTKADDTKKMYGGGLFGDKMYQDAKIKTVNPGLSASGGMIGKFRQKKGYFDSPSTDSEAKTKKPGRVEFSDSKPELKEFVKTNPKTKKKSLASYKEAWDDGRFTVKDGKRTDKFGNTYSDDAAGYAKFVEASKKYWSDMAGLEEKKTKGTSELRRDTQSGKMDPPMKKKRGYKMNSPLKNYRNPRDYKVFNMGNEASPSFKKKKKY